MGRGFKKGVKMMKHIEILELALEAAEEKVRVHRQKLNAAMKTVSTDRHGRDYCAYWLAYWESKTEILRNLIEVEVG